MPGRFPQKYRALWAGLTFTASTSTGLHCAQNRHKTFMVISINLIHGNKDSKSRKTR